MKNFEDPIQFNLKKKYEDIEIEYFDLMEITQGGPEVGNLAINGSFLKGRYGGPAIISKDKHIYVPAFVKKFWRTGFKLIRINSKTLEVEYLSETTNLIFLDRIEGNRIYYFQDLNKTILKYIEIS